MLLDSQKRLNSSCCSSSYYRLDRSSTMPYGIVFLVGLRLIVKPQTLRFLVHKSFASFYLGHSHTSISICSYTKVFSVHFNVYSSRERMSPKWARNIMNFLYLRNLDCYLLELQVVNTNKYFYFNNYQYITFIKPHKIIALQGRCQELGILTSLCPKTRIQYLGDHCGLFVVKQRTLFGLSKRRSHLEAIEKSVEA